MKKKQRASNPSTPSPNSPFPINLSPPPDLRFTHDHPHPQATTTSYTTGDATRRESRSRWPEREGVWETPKKGVYNCSPSTLNQNNCGKRRWNQEEEPVTLVTATGGEIRRSGGGDNGYTRPKVDVIGFRARSHGGARDHFHSNQEELRTRFE